MWRRLVIISVFFSVCVAQYLDGTFLYRSVKICDETHEYDAKCSDDCKTIDLCSFTSGSSYSWEPYRQCPDDQICDESGEKVKCQKKDGTGVCVIKTDKVSCNESGVYPHPHDCTKFITCDAEKKVNSIYSCAPGFMFSACTKNCDWNFNEDECDRTDIHCTKLLMEETFQVYSNNRMYYQCSYDGEDYFPKFFNCKKGTIFNEVSKQCEDHELPGCGIQ